MVVLITGGDVFAESSLESIEGYVKARLALWFKIFMGPVTLSPLEDLNLSNMTKP